MLSPRGQAGLEAKILSSASDSASKVCPRVTSLLLIIILNPPANVGQTVDYSMN